MFAGEAKMNGYAHMLKASAMVLWGARSVLLASVLLHVYSAIKLYKRRGDARPWLRLKQPHGSTYAARTMIWSGPSSRSSSSTTSCTSRWAPPIRSRRA